MPVMPEQGSLGKAGTTDLASFGEELRREREIRGISLKEISDATKISKRFLEALERNDHRTLPAPVFTRGFVREYARYVGLNADEMVNRYNAGSAKDDRIEKPPQIQRYPETPVPDIAPKVPRKRGIPLAFTTVDGNAIALVLIAAALAAVAWWALRNRRHEIVQPAVDQSTRQPAARVVPPAPEPVAVPAPATGDGVLRLRIEATGNSWIALEADGKTVLSAEMARGESREFEASEGFVFRVVGNAAGVRLTLNGTAIPALGDEGEVVRDRAFDRDALDRLRNAPPVAESKKAP